MTPSKFYRPALRRRAAAMMKNPYRNITVTINEDVVERPRIRITPDGRMTRPDASRYLGVASKTLSMWQLQGKGPRSVKVGGKIFYYLDDLDAFIQS
jgi:hypothetical protein